MQDWISRTEEVSIIDYESREYCGHSRFLDEGCDDVKELPYTVEEPWWIF